MALGTLRDHLLTIEPNTETLESTLLIYFLYGVALVNNLNDELIKIIQLHSLVAVPGANLSLVVVLHLLLLSVKLLQVDPLLLELDQRPGVCKEHIESMVS